MELTEKAATHSHSTIMPALRYQDAPAAIDWLCQVLGFEKKVVYPGPNGTIGHAELTLGGGMIMLGSHKDDAYGRGFKSPGEVGGVETRSAYVVVQDADAVYARAQAAGAPVVRPIQNTDYGSREFTVKDPEGHSWSVGRMIRGRNRGEGARRTSVSGHRAVDVTGGPMLARV